MVLPSAWSSLDTILPSHSHLLQSLPTHPSTGCTYTATALEDSTELAFSPPAPNGPLTLRLISGKP